MNQKVNNTDGHMMELMVADMLRRSGFVIIEQNYKVGHLEVDLIAMEDDILCFIEVKARAKPIRYEELDTIIPYRKRENIIHVADCYCRNNTKIKYSNIRFDYILVFAHGTDTAKIQYIRNAFTPTHRDLL